MPIASVADRFTPLTIAALLAWILCVCVHEFAHALVAYWGGDQSVRRRGYLSLDPTKYIDPMFSLIVPAVVLLLGGLPLPGGAVRIDEGALRNRRWIAYVSAAGPVGNLVLFLLFSLPLHPKLGLVEPSTMVQPTWALFCGAMAFLNFIAAMFNLIPVPPLDGYRLIEHRLPADLQWKLRQPQMAMVGFGLLFLAFAVFDWVWIPFLVMHDLVTGALGLPTHLILSGYTYVILGAAG